LFFDLSGDNAAAILLSPAVVPVESYRAANKEVECKTLSVASTTSSSTTEPSFATVSYECGDVATFYYALSKLNATTAAVTDFAKIREMTLDVGLT
jgi:hypothetical protein